MLMACGRSARSRRTRRTGIAYPPCERVFIRAVVSLLCFHLMLYAGLDIVCRETLHVRAVSPVFLDRRFVVIDLCVVPCTVLDLPGFTLSEAPFAGRPVTACAYAIVLSYMASLASCATSADHGHDTVASVTGLVADATEIIRSVDFGTTRKNSSSDRRTVVVYDVFLQVVLQSGGEAPSRPKCPSCPTRGQ